MFSGGMRLAGIAGAVAAAIVVSHVSAHAQQLPGPKKSKRYQTTFVQAFTPCTSTNDTTTGAIALPACHPAIPVDTGCGFGPDGKGNGMATVLPADGVNPQDVELRGRLVGLNAGCEGETVCVSATIVVSTVGCASDDPAGCTMTTLTDFAIGSGNNGCGVVQNGKVKLRTTVNTAFNAEVLNSNTVIQIRGVGIKRTTSVNSPAPSASSFESGLQTQ